MRRRWSLALLAWLWPRLGRLPLGSLTRGEFAPFLHLAAATLVAAAGAMFAIATGRTSMAFAEITSFRASFVNRELGASYTVDPERRLVQVLAITIDERTGEARAVTVAVDVVQVARLKTDIVDAAWSDRQTFEAARQDIREQSLVTQSTEKVIGGRERPFTGQCWGPRRPGPGPRPAARRS